MSGGHWDYLQYRLTDVAEDIDKLIKNNGKPKTEKELNESWYDDEWYEKYPEELNHHKYSDEVIKQFKSASAMVKIAQIYIQRIDWLLSGDDGSKSFLRRIDEDLKKLQDEQNYQKEEDRS